jgi:DNA transposition AAA+ family ATPase
VDHENKEEEDPDYARKQQAVESLAVLPDDYGPLPLKRPQFLTTKEHRRFTEFADACRRDRYIGLCYGPPGVGKTLSARQYAHWDELEPILNHWRHNYTEMQDRSDLHTLLYTPTLGVTPRVLSKELVALGQYLSVIRATGPLDPRAYSAAHGSPLYTELLIVDEADRLKTPDLEQLRDHYDRSQMGTILIGMPGIEKRLARYPQLYSRIGFVHEYRPLSADELGFVLQRHWATLGLKLSADDFTDTEAIAAVHRITSGNFRLVQRLFAQITRVLEINGLSVISREVVETARESLVIGTL